MFGWIRRLLGYRVTIAELIGIALILGGPYVIVGAFWSISHSDHLQDMRGLDLVVSFVGSVIFWPALLVSDVCMK